MGNHTLCHPERCVHGHIRHCPGRQPKRGKLSTVSILVFENDDDYRMASQSRVLAAALVTVGGRIVKNKLHPGIASAKHPKIVNDNACFIAEEAFKAGFMACVAAALSGEASNAKIEQYAHEAWSAYEPSEAVKECTTGEPDPQEY